jgi:hypothetical protein
MSAESIINVGATWNQEYRVLSDDGTAYDGTGATVAASLRIEGVEYDLAAGWVTPASGGVALLTYEPDEEAPLPAPAVGEVYVTVTQGGQTQSAGVFTIHTRAPGVAAPAIEEGS